MVLNKINFSKPNPKSSEFSTLIFSGLMLDNVVSTKSPQNQTLVMVREITPSLAPLNLKS
jgi:hypothetical protein